MRRLDLIKGKNHIILSVYKSSNSFGDQILEFVHEDIGGTVTRQYEAFPEGNWASFTVSNMMSLWEHLKNKN